MTLQQAFDRAGLTTEQQEKILEGAPSLWKLLNVDTNWFKDVMEKDGGSAVRFELLSSSADYWSTQFPAMKNTQVSQFPIETFRSWTDISIAGESAASYKIPGVPTVPRDR